MPYLRHIWPKSREVVTPAISESFASLCVAADNAFPDAVGALRHWLQPLSYPEFIVRLLDEAKLCERFPNEAMAFLDLVIGESQWPLTRLGRASRNWSSGTRLASGRPAPEAPTNSQRPVKKHSVLAPRGSSLLN